MAPENLKIFESGGEIKASSVFGASFMTRTITGVSEWELLMVESEAAKGLRLTGKDGKSILSLGEEERVFFVMSSKSLHAIQSHELCPCCHPNRVLVCSCAESQMRCQREWMARGVE